MGTGFRLRDGLEVVTGEDASYVTDPATGRSPLAEGSA